MARLEKILLFLTIFFLPTQLGKHFWPEFSFIYSLPIDYLSPTLYFWDILVISLCTVFILQNKHINRLALNLFYLFILTQSLSLIFSGSIGVGLVRLEQYLISGLFGVYIASQASKFKSIIFWGLGLAILMESSISLLQFITGGTLGLWILGERTFSISTSGIAKFDFRGVQFLRPYGTFPHPNVLAGFMVTVPVILNVVKDLSRMRPPNKWRDSSLLLGMTIVLSGVTTILTVSRVALLAGYLETAFLLPRKWKMVLVAVVLVLLPFIFIRFSSLFSFDSLTILRRAELASSALKLFATSPILGIGLNNFIPLSAEGLVSGPSRFLQPVHNIFLLALSETGLVGLLGLLVMFGYPIIKLFKLSPKPLPCRQAGYPLNPILVIWAVVIFLGMFDHYFLTLPQGYRLLFLVWGLSLSMLNLKSAKSS